MTARRACQSGHCPDCGARLDPEPHPHCSRCVWRDMSAGVNWCGRGGPEHACSRAAGHAGGCRCFCGARLPAPGELARRARLGALDALLEGQRRRIQGFGGVCGGRRNFVRGG